MASFSHGKGRVNTRCGLDRAGRTPFSLLRVYDSRRLELWRRRIHWRTAPGFTGTTPTPARTGNGAILLRPSAGEAAMRTRYAQIPANSFEIRDPAISKSRTYP